MSKTTLYAESDAGVEGDVGLVPKHVGIIMDGNHRWAQKRHLPGAAGHRAGAKGVRKISEACVEQGIESLTLFAFSTENWYRPEGEVKHAHGLDALCHAHRPGRLACSRREAAHYR